MIQEKQYVTSQGTTLVYIDQGAGPVLVLLHGWGSSKQAFMGLIPELAKNFRVIALDFPGFGTSEIPKTPWTVFDYSQVVVELLRSLSISKAHLLCHSFGGRVALKLAVHNPSLVHGLILTGSAGVERKQKWIKRKVLARAARVVKGALLVLGPLGRKGIQSVSRTMGSTDFLTSGPLKETYLNVIHENLLEDARKVTAPTLLIWGEDDLETPLADGKLLHAQIPGSELFVIAHAGHYAFLDNPTKFILSVKKFLHV